MKGARTNERVCNWVKVFDRITAGKNLLENIISNQSKTELQCILALSKYQTCGAHENAAYKT